MTSEATTYHVTGTDFLYRNGHQQEDNDVACRDVISAQVSAEGDGERKKRHKAGDFTQVFGTGTGPMTQQG